MFSLIFLKLWEQRFVTKGYVYILRRKEFKELEIHRLNSGERFIQKKVDPEIFAVFQSQN